MLYFLKYLESIGEFWIVIDEDEILRSNEDKNEIEFMYTEWNGIFNFDLQINTIYNVKNLIKKLENCD